MLKTQTLKMGEINRKELVEEDKFDDFIAAFHLNFLRCGG